MRLLSKGKVEVLKATERILRSSDRTWEIYIPKILRLVKLVRSIYKTKVPWNKKNVIVRDRSICQFCGTIERKMTVDHVIPSSRGGKSTFDNCVCSCKSCNNRKGDKTPREAQMSLKRQPWPPTIMEFINIKMKTLGIDKVLEDLWKNEQ